MPLGSFRLNGLAKRFAVTASRPAITFINSSVTLNTTTKVFGNGAAAVGSNAGRFLRSSDLPQISGNFTIEGWFRLQDTSGGRGQLIRNWSYDGSTYTTGSFDFYYSNTSNARLDLNGATSITFGTTRFQFQHIAIVRSGSTVTIYRDGTSVGSTTWSQTLNASFLQWHIGGRNGGDSLNGLFDEVRFSNVARYTSNFSPITSPFVNDANTIFLLHFDGLPFTDDNL